MEDTNLNTEDTNQAADALPVEDAGQLKEVLGQLAAQYRYFGSRKQRCEELMRRKIAKTWTSKKKATMIRRLITSNKAIAELENFMTQVSDRLRHDHGIEVEVKSRSNSIPVTV